MAHLRKGYHVTVTDSLLAQVPRYVPGQSQVLLPTQVLDLPVQPVKYLTVTRLLPLQHLSEGVHGQPTTGSATSLVTRRRNILPRNLRLGDGALITGILGRPGLAR